MAQIEVSLLKFGIPFAALESASEDQVIRWWALVSEANEAEAQRMNSMIEGMG